MKTHPLKHPLRATVARGTITLLISAALFLGSGLMPAIAGYALSWSKIAGGGGTSRSLQYKLSGTLGQHDAGAPMTGGNYSLTGGFLAAFAAVQTPGAPLLTITRSGSNIVLFWAGPASGYALEQTPALGNTAWTSINVTPVDNGGTRSVTLPLAPGNWFFRLKK